LPRGCASVEEYFRSGTFISEIENIYQITDWIVKHIDPETGKRR
jgi:hypothetical protein